MVRDSTLSSHCHFSTSDAFPVAVQCLETAFNVSTDDQTLAVTQTLPEIFASATLKVNLRHPLYMKLNMWSIVCLKCVDCLLQHPNTLQVNINTATDSPTEEEEAEAERLKTDGRTFPVNSLYITQSSISALFKWV